MCAWAKIERKELRRHLVSPLSNSDAINIFTHEPLFDGASFKSNLYRYGQTPWHLLQWLGYSLPQRILRVLLARGLLGFLLVLLSYTAFRIYTQPRLQINLLFWCCRTPLVLLQQESNDVYQLVHFSVGFLRQNSSFSTIYGIVIVRQFFVVTDRDWYDLPSNGVLMSPPDDFFNQ